MHIRPGTNAFPLAWCVCLGMLLLVFLNPGSAVACSTAVANPQEDPGLIYRSASKRLEVAAVVFEGSILDISSDGRVAMVAVDQYFKGLGPAEVAISGFGRAGECFYPVAQSGRHAIFCTFGDPYDLLRTFTPMPHYTIDDIVGAVRELPLTAVQCSQSVLL